MKYTTDEHGFYGAYGGAYVPEMLHRNLAALQAAYPEIISQPDFKEEWQMLLHDYVGRPSPLYHAARLSEKYDTHIYLKREDLNHTGAHKINNTIGQVLLAKRMGLRRIIAETGAGQHGVAAATVCALMGLTCIIYMGATDMERQQPNVERMRLLGATVKPAVSGNATLKDATNEAIRDWIAHPDDTYYIIGSVVGPHPYPEIVRHFQRIIGEEIKQQFSDKTGKENPDVLIACVGGGSNAAGTFDAFLDAPDVKLIGVEAAGKGVHTNENAATLANGSKGIIHGSMTRLMQTDDGQIMEPYSISAGLDYPGIGPLHAYLAETGRATYLAATDDQALAAAYQLMRLEGIIPALESAHALAALDLTDFDKEAHVVICLSGRGDKDLATYIQHKEKFGNTHPAASHPIKDGRQEVTKNESI